MLGFFFKKAFFDGWDHLFSLLLLNLGFCLLVILGLSVPPLLKAAGLVAAFYALLILLARPANLPLLMKEVFLVQAAMPAMTQTPILAETYGADSEYAGVATSLSTVLSLATIPLCMVLIGRVF